METNPKNLNITVYGAGYVGLVTAACFAKLGYQVLCVDINAAKIAELNNGRVPIYEPGLEDLITNSISKQRLHFTTDISAAVNFGFYHFIAVGTPPAADGSADLQYVFSVAKTIGEYRQDYCIIIDKSTVPVGTADKINQLIKDTANKLNKPFDYSVVSNPEFLKEGSAIQDFMQPDRIVVGANDAQAITMMQELYSPFIMQGYQFISMDTLSAELTKYTANAMLATKISFMNEISQIAERVGADIELVKKGISLDPRIGALFINPGCGYGGSCFPKDVKALYATAKQHGYEASLLQTVDQVNIRQKQVLFNKIQRYFNNQLQQKIIAVWGLAFKPNTNDIRDSASIDLIKALLAAGITVQAYDPIAMPEFKQLFGDTPGLNLCDTAQDTLQNADGLAIVTEWAEFRAFAPARIKEYLKQPVIFDGRNIYDPIVLRKLGIKYLGIGHGERL
jgi:UDPglucose 6-dehydrogenase